MTTYTSRDYKISLCLLHTENTRYQYPNLSTIASALETFQTIVQIESSIKHQNIDVASQFPKDECSNIHQFVTPAGCCRRP